MYRCFKEPPRAFPFQETGVMGEACHVNRYPPAKPYILFSLVQILRSNPTWVLLVSPVDVSQFFFFFSTYRARGTRPGKDGSVEDGKCLLSRHHPQVWALSRLLARRAAFLQPKGKKLLLLPRGRSYCSWSRAQTGLEFQALWNSPIQMFPCQWSLSGPSSLHGKPVTPAYSGMIFSSVFSVASWEENLSKCCHEGPWALMVRSEWTVADLSLLFLFFKISTAKAMIRWITNIPHHSGANYYMNHYSASHLYPILINSRQLFLAVILQHATGCCEESTSNRYLLLFD